MWKRLSPMAVLTSALTVLSIAIAQPASAQSLYYFTLNATPGGSATCGSTSFDVPIVGTISYNLPSPPNNEWVSLAVNGGTPTENLYTQATTSGTSTPSSFGPSWATPVQAPYDVTLLIFPALNGAPVGTGFGVFVHCSALGASGGVATFCSSVALGGQCGTAVPAMPAKTLIALLGLLAGAAVWQLRRA